jgi:hypothetical protein
VLPQIVLTNDLDKLDKDFIKEEFFTALSSMQNGNFLGLDGLPFEFTKAI